jgi:Rrf2 family protein
MLSLTRKTDYALVALAYLGQKRAEAGSTQSPAPAEAAVSAREIAGAFGLPLPLLMNVLKDLGRARLVVSTRGASGGYVLAADPAKVTLLEVVTAIEGPLRVANCAEGLPLTGQGSCRVNAGCPIRGPIKHLHDRIHQFLSDVTLADLLEAKVDVTAAQVGVAVGVEQ